MKHHSNKYIIFTLLLFSIIFSLTAQNSDDLWSKTSELEKTSSKKIKRKSIPTNFGVHQLNLSRLKSKLGNTPKRKGKLVKSNTILSFPNEKGQLEKYQVFEVSILEESLQKKHPNIKSYIGKGIDNPSSVVRFSVTSIGLHAMVLQKSGDAVYIDPYTSNKESYIVYTKKNLSEVNQFECKFDELNSESKFETSNVSAKNNNADDGILRTFRLAIATTGEYSQFHLNNQGISSNATDEVKKDAVLSAIVVTMTRVNGVFEKDVALTMQLVANNTDIIFLDPLTDNFTNNDGSNLINESQTVIDAAIGSENYDIGHTFGTNGEVSRAQRASVCIPSDKARGITGSSSTLGDPFAIDFVAHEMGHQFGANHTFNSDSGGCGGSNRNGGTAVEPGSGTTIMGYAGLCSPYDVQQHSDAYFHLVSIREMWSNITSGNSTCAAKDPTGNKAPILEALSSYTIPVSTPFILNANGSDTDGDSLTYTWEQLDTEITAHPLESIATGGPAFRSLSPSSSSMRYFPAQSTVIVGDLSSTWEVLPSVGRTMTFGVTVRDNNTTVGQTASEETTITVDGNSAPFKMTSQITSEIWNEGASQIITWDVANTNVSPINCSFVNILLSTDGGNTYPITLASNVSNDGSQIIVAPSSSTTTGRIKIESVGNVFYTMNSANITIQSSEFIMNFDSYNEAICSPNEVVYTFTYTTFLGFNDVTTFSATDNPVGTTVTFNPTSAKEDNTVVEMTVTGITNNAVGNYKISAIGTSASVTRTSVVDLNVYSSVINIPNLVSPENNLINVLKPYVLNWESDFNALNYNVQISTDNTFTTITEEYTGPNNVYSPLLLQLNTNYFWRVKSTNYCGESSFSSIYNFTTLNEVCDSDNSTDTPLDIPDNNAVGISSVINLKNNKMITDVNVTVNITHPWIGDLTLNLISPQGTSVLLVSSREDEGDNYSNTIFDDAATSSINTGTAPYTGLFKPQGSLSIFNNEESFGEWTLKVVDSGPVDFGSIESWSIEICGVDKAFILPSDNFNIEVISETCPDKDNGEIIIEAQYNQNYVATINGVTIDETVVNLPNVNFSDNLSVVDLVPGTYNICIIIEGSSFEQCYTVEVISGEEILAEAKVDSNKATIEIIIGTAPYTIYVNGEETFKTNSSVFNVEVKHGDLVEVKTSVSCEGVYSKTIELLDKIVAYPNPTNGIFEIALPVTQKEVTIELYTIHSQLISVKAYPIVYGRVQLNIEDKPSGMYIAKVHIDKPVTLKIIKQ